MIAQNTTPRQLLPIPDIPHGGLTTHDAEGPDSRYR